MQSDSDDGLQDAFAQLVEARSRLDDGEIPWRERQPFLESRGYMLRPRYRPGWTPSWLGKDVDYEECEDWHVQIVSSPAFYLSFVMTAVGYFPHRRGADLRQQASVHQGRPNE